MDDASAEREMTFEDAVDFAYESLMVLEELPDQAERMAAIIFQVVKQGNEKTLKSFVEDSENNGLVFDGLSRVAGRLILRGSDLGIVLSHWVGRRLLEEVSRPLRSRRFRKAWPGENEELELILYDTVRELVELGLSSTRNDASPPLSACDAVAAAMGLHGAKPTSYKEIKRIYLKIKKRYEGGGDPGLDVAFSNWLIEDMRAK